MSRILYAALAVGAVMVILGAGYLFEEKEKILTKIFKFIQIYLMSLLLSLW